MNKKPQSQILQLQVIKTKDHVYISDNVSSSSYHVTKIPHLFFDGEKAENTYQQYWYKIKSIPAKVQEEVEGTKFNERYELKPEHKSINLPEVAQKEDFEDNGKYESVYGLYKYKYDMTDPTFEDVDFELHIVEELDHFEITKSEFYPKYSLLDRIQTPSVLLPTKPCKLSKEDSYKIIREYIKRNIDHEWAKITSDYDFCLTVSKLIKHEPIKYLVDVGKRKSKWEERYRSQRTVPIYEATPSKYQGYPDVIEFEGKNEEELKNNIKTYLENLMKEINEPWIDCKCCKGLGVVNFNETEKDGN